MFQLFDILIVRIYHSILIIYNIEWVQGTVEPNETDKEIDKTQ
jgi:hypothetical protein